MKRLLSIFRRLDTTSCCAALDEAEKAQRGVRVRTRAIGMDVSCGDPAAAVRRIMERIRHPFMTVLPGIPADMQGLLDRIR
jgi:hypothetical protein